MKEKKTRKTENQTEDCKQFRFGQAKIIVQKKATALPKCRQ